MKKIRNITLLVVIAIGLSSSTPHDSVSVKLHNPCSKSILFGHSSKTNGANVSLSVAAGKTSSFTAPEGHYINYRPAPGKNYVPIGKVEYKGQVFTCGCQ